MIGYVANTHHDWFDFLAARETWEEVNFWSPSAYYSFRGDPGSPFFFRLKSPRNAIGGFGTVSRFARLPEWLAWDCFGQGNGASSLQVLQARLTSIREQNKIANEGELQQIGCLILSNAIFFKREAWIAQPADWGRQNLRYKGYELGAGEGARIWQECRARVAERDLMSRQHMTEPANRYGAPIMVLPRLGQGAFRVSVTEAYGRACAVTREHSLPALEAAHIKPFALEGPHETVNGILLRSDLHRLFDRGYVTVTPDYRLEVGKLLKEHFSNGRSYYPLHGQSIALPRTARDRPNPELLRWHNETKFLG